MGHSQNIYGLFVCLFVVYRYVCVDVIITNSTIAYCLQPYLVLHRLLYMFINYFVLQNWPTVLHRLLILSLLFFLQSNKASFSYHLLCSKIYVNKPCAIILCRIT